jgi:hypothetical protein
MVEAQLVSLFYGQGPTRSPAWYPSPEIQKALKDLSAASAGPTFELPLKTQHLDALQEIMQSLLSPFDLSQSGQVEFFVQRFLQIRSLRRLH